MGQLPRPVDIVQAISGSDNSAKDVNEAEWATANTYPVAILVSLEGGKPGAISQSDVELDIHSMDCRARECELSFPGESGHGFCATLAAWMVDDSS